MITSKETLTIRTKNTKKSILRKYESLIREAAEQNKKKIGIKPIIYDAFN